MLKYIFNLVIITCISVISLAQNTVERTYQPEYLTDFVNLLVHDGNYYLGSNNTVGSFTGNKVVKMSRAGYLKWDVNLNTLEASFISGLFVRNKEIWAFNRQITNCDAIFYSKIELYRFDTLSSLIGQSTIVQNNGESDFDPETSVCEMQNGNILLYINDSLLAIDNNGHVTWTTYHQSSSYNNVLAAGLNNQIVFYTEDGIKVLDSLGSQITQITLPTNPKFGKVLSPSQYALVAGATVLIADSSFNITNQQSLSSYVSSISHLLIDGTDIFVCGEKPSDRNTAVIVKLDTALNIINSRELAGTVINEMAMDDSLLVCAGKEVFTQCPETLVTSQYVVYGGFFKTFKKDLSSMEYTHDGAIIEVIVDSAYTNWTSSIARNIYIDLGVRIKNNGDEPINTKGLSYTAINSWGICAPPYFFQNSGSTLNPGEEMFIDFGWVNDVAYTPMFTSDVYTSEVCMVLSSPSPHLDDDHSNNCGCANYSVNVGLEDIQANANLAVFPNPTQDKVNISFELNKEAVFSAIVYDVSGRQVKQLGNQNYASGKHNIIWDASTYPSGLYYCHITIGNESVVEKVSVVK